MNDNDDSLIPAELQNGHRNLVSALTVGPSYRDSDSGATWLWDQSKQAYVEVIAPYAHEEHLPPFVKHDIMLGSIESLAEYVMAYRAINAAPLITWNRSGIKVQLDYHTAEEVGPCLWSAAHLWTLSREWREWTTFCNGQSRAHQQTVEFLENHFDDLDEPTSRELAEVIRSMKGVLNKSVESTVNPNGTTKLAQTDDRSVNVTIPTEFKLAIPVLEGDSKMVQPADGDPPYEVPVLQELTVRMRVSVDGSDARVSFRMVIPTALRVLDRKIAQRVADFRDAVEGLKVLRSADD